MQEKDKNIDNVIKSAGRTIISVDNVKLKKDKKLLVKLAKHNKIRNRSDLTAILMEYNAENPKEMVIGDPQYLTNLVNLVNLQLRNSKSNDKKQGSKINDDLITKLKLNEFEDFRENEIYEYIIEEKGNKWEDSENDISAYEDKIIHGLTYDQISIDFKKRGINKGDRGNIWKIVDKVRIYVNLYGGLLVEKKLKEFLLKSKLFDEVVRMGGVSEPDVYAIKNNEYFIFSVKAQTVKTLIHPADMKPEFKFTMDKQLNGYKCHLFLAFYDIKKKKLKMRRLKLENQQGVKF